MSQNSDKAGKLGNGKAVDGAPPIDAWRDQLPHDEADNTEEEYRKAILSAE